MASGDESPSAGLIIAGVGLFVMVVGVVLCLWFVAGDPWVGG